MRNKCLLLVIVFVFAHRYYRIALHRIQFYNLRASNGAPLKGPNGMIPT